MVNVQVVEFSQKMALNAKNVPKAIFLQQMAKHVGDAHIIKFPMKMGQNFKNAQKDKFAQKMVLIAKIVQEVIFLQEMDLLAWNVQIPNILHMMECYV